LTFVLKNIYVFYVFVIFITYTMNNVKIMGKGSASIELLFILFISLFLNIAINFKKIGKVSIQKSFYVIVLFFLYLIINIVIDTQNTSILSSYTISTSGGIILFYVLGVYLIYLINILEYQLKFNIKFLKYFIFMFIFLLIYNLYMVSDIFLYLVGDIRDDIFMIHDDTNYQRPANFLTINYIFLSILYLKILVYVKYFNKYKYRFITINLLLYLNFIVAILLSQMIGSNNGFVSLSGILFLNILILFIKNHKIFFSNFRIKFSNILFGEKAFKIWISILKTTTILSVLLYVLIILLDIDLNLFRIFGFGNSEITSITSRIAILSHFVDQFNVSPIFGNMLSPEISGSSKGEFMHSFILSILTHLGLFGMIIIILYLYLSIKQLCNYNLNLYINNIETVYFILLFIGLFAIALLGTFFIWIPIWFLFGIIFKIQKRTIK